LSAGTGVAEEFPAITTEEPPTEEKWQAGTPAPTPAPRRRRLLVPMLVLALVAAAGVAAVVVLTAEKAATGTMRATYVVRRADLPIVIAETGSLDALKSEVIKSRVDGSTTILSLIEEGTIITEEDVKNGKVLVELDSSRVREKLTQQQITYASAEAAYKQAKEAYDIQKSTNESNIREADLNVKFSKMDLEAYVGEELADAALAGKIDLLKLAEQLYQEAREHRQRLEGQVAAALKGVERALKGQEATKQPDQASSEPQAAKALGVSEPGTQTHRLGGSALQQKRKLEADISLAYEEFKRAADKVISYANLTRLGVKSAQQLEAEQLALMRQRVTLEQALTARELFLRYEFPKQAEQLLSLYRERGRELERIKARARAALAQAEATLKSAESKYIVQKAELEDLQEQLRNCLIRAKKPGLVVYATTGRHWRYRGEPVREGGTVYERQDILKLPDLSTIAVRLRIHESVVDKVKVGLPARVKVDAFPKRQFTGKVIKVAMMPASDSSWLNPDLKEYETIVDIIGDKTGLKPGMSAQVEIDVKTLKNVLQVPIQAITARKGKTIVYVVGPDGAEEPREVEVGESNDTMVEIRSGLREGERILLEAPQIVLAKEEEEKPEEGEEEEAIAPPPRPPAAGQKGPARRPGQPQGGVRPGKAGGGARPGQPQGTGQRRPPARPPAS